MSINKVFIASACRTAIGSFGGTLVGHSAAELGRVCSTEAIKRAGLETQLNSFGEVIVGNVLAAGQGMNVARQIGIKAGLPVSTPAFTVNKVCGSGLKAINLAVDQIQLGHQDVVLCGGTESMSQAGFVSLSARWGARLGHSELRDLILQDGLTDVFNSCHMGITAENLAERYKISRAEQDAFALESQRRAAHAQSQGWFDAEIVPVPLMKKGQVVGQFQRDEFIRADSSLEALAKLAPAFKKDGTVTAGNASGINDGAAMVVLVSEAAIKKFGLKPLAEVLGYGTAGVDPAVMGIGPVGAVKCLLERTKLALSDMSWIEANEAFAAQSLAVTKELEWDLAKVNPNGGAIALGHPIGASGARVLVTLLHQLQRTKKELGLATLCVGGGQGIALAIRALPQ